MIDNVRAALDWAFSSDGDASIGISLPADLTPIWIRLSLISAECRAGRLAVLHGSARAGNGTAWSTTLRLARELNDTENQLRALRGLWAYRLNGGEYRAALSLANEFRALAKRQADERSARGGDRMASLILHYLGEQEQARELIAWSTDESNAALPSAAWYMINQGVAARALLARILWLQGFPDQATRSAETACARAAEAGIQIHRRHASPATLPQMPLHHASLTRLGPAIGGGAPQPYSRTVRKLAESWHIKRAAGEPCPLPLRSALQTHAS